jgi:hypothetical protein
MIPLNLDLSRVNTESASLSAKRVKDISTSSLSTDRTKYGNAGQVLHSVSKEERLAGRRGEVVGNWLIVGANKTKS